MTNAGMTPGMTPGMTTAGMARPEAGVAAGTCVAPEIAAAGNAAES
jgi:hypothetical protein